jgi:hypothetical protein
VNEAQRLHGLLHGALRAGDLQGVLFALGNSHDFANARDAYWNVHVLSHAIELAPLDRVRALLEAGADPNYEDLGGFPSLFWAIDAKRADGPALLALLLEFGADIQQRGINEYTPVHYAAARGDAAAIAALLAHGADPDARTRIDEQATPREEALRNGNPAALRALPEPQRRAERCPRVSARPPRKLPRDVRRTCRRQARARSSSRPPTDPRCSDRPQRDRESRHRRDRARDRRRRSAGRRA